MLIAVAVLVVAVAAIVAEVKTAKTKKVDNPETFDSLDELAESWAQSNYDKQIEYGSIILSKEENGKEVYFFDRVYDGNSYTIAYGFFSGYVHYGLDAIPSGNKIVGFIHSHPSAGTLPSDADKFIKTLAGIDVSYIAGSENNVQPYESEKTFWQALWDMLLAIPKYL